MMLSLRILPVFFVLPALCLRGAERPLHAADRFGRPASAPIVDLERVREPADFGECRTVMSAASPNTYPTSDADSLPPCQPLPDDAAGEFVRALRSACLQRGADIEITPTYIGEVMTNTHGGLSTQGATRYAGLLDLLATADLERLGLPIPARVVVLAQDTHGEGISDAFVGDTQIVSNIDSTDNIMQISEYWLEMDLIGDRLTLRIGKQDINNEFVVVDMALDFVQSSFGISPSLNVPTYPSASFAVVLLAHATADFNIKLGIWDGAPRVGNWGISGTGITLTAMEGEYEYALAEGALPGKLDVGVVYSSAGIDRGTHQPEAWGVYADWEQTLIREHADRDDDHQGLGGFLQYISSYPKQDVTFPEYFGAGLIYRGLLPARDADVVGVGMAKAHLHLGGRFREIAVESFYKVQVSEHVMIQPDLQYIISPSGLYRDALVAGLRLELDY